MQQRNATGLALTNSKIKGDLLVLVLRGRIEASLFVRSKLVGQCCRSNIGGHKGHQAGYQRRESHRVVVLVDVVELLVRRLEWDTLAQACSTIALQLSTPLATPATVTRGQLPGEHPSERNFAIADP